MSEIEQTPKYVVQIEHNNSLTSEQENPLPYLVKDAALTKRVTEIERLLNYYKGTIELNSGWQSVTVNEQSTIIGPGLYIVTAADSYQIFETETTSNDENRVRNNGAWSQLNINDLEALVEIILANTTQEDNEAEANTENEYIINVTPDLYYINNDLTAASQISLPGILIVSVNNESITSATLIDANGIIWKYSGKIDDTYDKWINLWDTKANINDLRQACTIIDLQSQAIKALNDNIVTLQQQIRNLESLKDLADILNMSIDVEGNYDNILVIGNDIDFYVENNRYPVQDVVKKYLRTNGTVVWLKTNTTIDAIQYVVKYVDNENNTLYPQFIADMNDNVRFNQIGNINADVFDVTKFDIIIILLNRNDLYTTTEYNNETLSKRIGTYNPQNRALPSTREPVKYEGDQYINYIPISLGNSTICAAILALVDTIRSNNSNAKLRIATPITWVPNNSTNMTSVQISAADALVKEIKDNLCSKEGIPFIDTQRIVNTTKDYELNDAGDAVKQNTINSYISEICASINTAAAGGQTVFNLSDTPTKGSFTLTTRKSGTRRTAYHDMTITPGVDGNVNVHLKYNKSNATKGGSEIQTGPQTEFYVLYRMNPSSEWNILDTITAGVCDKVLASSIACTATDTIEIRVRAWTNAITTPASTDDHYVSTQFNWEVSFSMQETTNS